MEYFRTPTFDAKVTGVKDLFDTMQTPFMPFFMVLHLRGVTGFTSVPTVSVGTNAPTYNNVLAATALTGLDAEGEYIRLPIGTELGSSGAFRGIAPGSSVSLKANVTVAAVATTYDLEVCIVGAYV